MGAGTSGAYNMGMVTIFTLGAFCHWRVLVAVSAIFPLAGLFFLFFVPESPAWYVTKGAPRSTPHQKLANLGQPTTLILGLVLYSSSGRYSDAKDALVWLRGGEVDTNGELEAMVKSYEATTKNETDDR